MKGARDVLNEADIHPRAGEGSAGGNSIRNGHRSVNGSYALTWESIASTRPVRHLPGTDRAQRATGIEPAGPAWKFSTPLAA